MGVNRFKKCLCVTCMCVAFLLAACGKVPEQAALEEQGSAKETEEQSGGAQQVVKIEEVTAGKMEFTVYYGNDNADAFVSEVITADQVTSALILEEMKKKGVVSADTKIQGLLKETVDGEVLLQLDLSKEFLDYISSMGSAGEYMIMGGLVNTFLDAYDADRIRITVDGQPLETPHEYYGGYFQFYPMD